jgi:hypothetical protein
VGAWNLDRPGNWIHAQTPDNVFSSDQWFFVAVRFRETTDENERLTITVNERSFKLPSQKVAYDSQDFSRIGGGTNAIGMLDEFVLYDRMLSDQEVDALYRGGLAGAPADRQITGPSEDPLRPRLKNSK